jgi:hypothetical protein
VSTASVHNDLHARRCQRYGGPVTNPIAEACIDCTRHLPTMPRTWTRALVAEAIRDWTGVVGSPPTYRDWTPSRTRALRWTAEHPRWPSASVVSALWSSHPDPWPSAVRDALDRQHHVAA